MIYLILIYISIIGYCFVFIWPRIKSIASDNGIGKKLDDLKNNLENKHGSMEIVELQQTPIIFFSWLKKVVESLFFLISFPIFVLNMVIIFKHGPKSLWKIPFSYYDVWYFTIILFSFFEAYSGSFWFPIVSSVVLILIIIWRLLDLFELKNNRLKISESPIHKNSIRENVFYVLLVISSYSCLYYTLDSGYPEMFNKKLTMIDAFYYSFMVGTTIGFGEIYPNSPLTKLLTISEGLIGYLFIIVFISFFMNIWTSKRLKE